MSTNTYLFSAFARDRTCCQFNASSNFIPTFCCAIASIGSERKKAIIYFFIDSFLDKTIPTPHDLRNYSHCFLLDQGCSYWYPGFCTRLGPRSISPNGMGYNCQFEFHVPPFTGAIVFITASIVPVLFRSNHRWPHSVNNSTFLSCMIAVSKDALSVAVVFPSLALLRIIFKSFCALLILFCCALASALIKYCSASRNTTRYSVTVAVVPIFLYLLG